MQALLRLESKLLLNIGKDRFHLVYFASIHKHQRWNGYLEQACLQS